MHRAGWCTSCSCQVSLAWASSIAMRKSLLACIVKSRSLLSSGTTDTRFCGCYEQHPTTRHLHRLERRRTTVRRRAAWSAPNGLGATDRRINARCHRAGLITGGDFESGRSCGGRIGSRDCLAAELVWFRQISIVPAAPVHVSRAGMVSAARSRAGAPRRRPRRTPAGRRSAGARCTPDRRPRPRAG
jgi:hypothetical protein